MVSPKSLTLPACASLALAVWGCGESPVLTSASSVDPPTARHEVAASGFFTGGGRIDCSVGEARPCAPIKSTPESHDFQTWGFVFGDKNGDGIVEGSLEHVDHRDAFRIGGSPRNYHSESWDFFENRDPDLPCPGGGDGAAIAGGMIERKNDGTLWRFVIYVADCGEPGTKTPHDLYSLEVADGYEVSGRLTGGNIQAHINRNAP